jgi:pSer/pThr/pTyr-binding forkhead associated (FHA) protein
MAFLQIYFNSELKFVAPLNPAVTKVGREADNDVVIDNAGVSGYHAIFVQVGDAFFVEDMASTNGVFLNGQRVSREQIHFGDVITIHKHKLKFTAVNMAADAVIAPVTATQAINQGQTMEVDVSQLQALLQQQLALVPYLQQTSGELRGHKWMLSKQQFEMGKGTDCDLRVDGWFTPKLIARISRQSDGYYLYPENKWRRIRLNGVAVDGRVKLQNRDRLQLRGIALTFCQSAAPQPRDI